MKRAATAAAIAIASGAAAAAPPPPAKDKPANTPRLAGPAPEVRKGGDGGVALPTIPSFQLPPSEPGLHSPRELLVAGKKLLNTEVVVKGYITWIYDCASAVGRTGERVAAVKKRIDDDPTLCERPKFYLGSDKDTPPERSLWVVDVPRPPTKLEKRRLPKDELAKWPAVPRLAVGDLVVVTGELALRSPHAETNSDGLIVYRALVPGKPVPAAASAPAAPPSRPAVPPPAIAKHVPARTDAALQTSSVARSNAATRAYGQKQLATAITEYQRAVAEWPDNHIAWYGLAGAHAGNRDWRAARDAVAHAVAIEPGQAMYHLIHGVAQYEAAVQQAREDQARAENKPADDVVVDRSALQLDGALSSLAEAVRLNRDLWRAHYYLGRIYRDRGDARWAAEELDAALRSAPAEPGPWVALVELYRLWGYPVAAIGVAQQGVAAVADAPELYYTLAMAFADVHKDAEAIDAFSRVLALRADHPGARFQRGQVHFRMHERAKAKQDLEEFLAAPGGDPFARQAASKMLLDLAAKK